MKKHGYVQNGLRATFMLKSKIKKTMISSTLGFQRFAPDFWDTHVLKTDGLT
jgi:hypothetical protein